MEERSFTHALIKVLERERKAHNGCDIMTLQSLLNSRKSRDRYKLQADPFFWVPCSQVRGRPRIWLHTLTAGAKSQGADMLTPDQRQTLSDARMLLKISFSDPDDNPLLEEWEEFLRHRPANIFDIKFYLHTQTKLHACFETHSNAAIMSIPLWLWDLLEPHPAIEPISVVRSENLTEKTASGGDSETKEPAAPTDRPNPVPADDLVYLTDDDFVYQGPAPPPAVVVSHMMTKAGGRRPEPKEMDKTTVRVLREGLFRFVAGVKRPRNPDKIPLRVLADFKLVDDEDTTWMKMLDRDTEKISLDRI